jgi:hypothetical protein
MPGGSGTATTTRRRRPVAASRALGAPPWPRGSRVDAAFGLRIPARHRGLLEHLRGRQVGREALRSAVALATGPRPISSSALCMPSPRRPGAQDGLGSAASSWPARVAARSGGRPAPTALRRARRRPRFRPESSAASILTSNQDSIECETNCTDTMKTTTPGRMPMPANSSIRRPSGASRTCRLVARVQARQRDHARAPAARRRRGVQPQQPGIVAVEEAGVAGRGGEQEQQDRPIALPITSA